MTAWMLYYADLRLVLRAANSLTISVETGFQKRTSAPTAIDTVFKINTNMYAEVFNCVFKRNYLKGKVNKRVDACLVNLLKYTRNVRFDRLIKITKGRLTYRMSMICERHKQSLLLVKWKVLSENGKIYEVTESVEPCSGKTYVK